MKRQRIAMSDPAHFQSEKLKRDIDSTNALVESRFKTMLQSNHDLGDLVVFLSKELEKIQRDAPQPFSAQAGAAVSSGRQRMTQIIARSIQNLQKEPK